jgi:hypothetical protein
MVQMGWSREVGSVGWGTNSISFNFHKDLSWYGRVIGNYIASVHSAYCTAWRWYMYSFITKSVTILTSIYQHWMPVQWNKENLSPSVGRGTYAQKKVRVLWPVLSGKKRHKMAKKCLETATKRSKIGHDITWKKAKKSQKCVKNAKNGK